MVKGVIAGNFDVLHPGYINMFKDCYNKCTSLVVLLHEDPSLERPHKKKPVLSVEERKVCRGLQSVLGMNLKRRGEG